MLFRALNNCFMETLKNTSRKIGHIKIQTFTIAVFLIHVKYFEIWDPIMVIFKNKSLRIRPYP